MKKILYFGALFTIVLSFLLYFYSFSTSDVSNLIASVSNVDNSGWTLSERVDGENKPVDEGDAAFSDNTILMERIVPEVWGAYDRIVVDSGRAISIYIDNRLVFKNHDANTSISDELPLMKKPEGELTLIDVSFDPSWVGKKMEVLTRRFDNVSINSIEFVLESDTVLLYQQEVWTNRNAIPGAMFGVITLLLVALFFYRLVTTGKGFPILLLAFASLLQMFSYMSILHENPFPMLNVTIANALYFLFPLLYLQTKFTSPKIKKRFFWITSIVWGIYFAIFYTVYELHVFITPWFDRVEALCFINLAVMLYYCYKEYKKNVFIKHYVSLLGLFSIGYLLLFMITGIVDQNLNEYMSIIFIEASRFYFRPFIFWVFTTILIALFILAAWDALRDQIQKEKLLEQAENEKVLLDLQVEGAKNQLQSLRSSQEQTVIYRHDMRHHFTLLQEYAKENDMEKIKAYLAMSKKDIDALTPKRFCSNETVNILLAAFDEKAKNMNIVLDINAKVAESLAIGDHELCTLLSNAIENAMQAVEHIEDESKRVVEVQLQMHETALLISVKNAYEGELIEDGVSFMSRHKEEGHGLGVKSILSIVEKYGGMYSIDTDGGEFVLRLVIPLDM
ncbi:sensor histidine kinase [Amedibacillus sp. YH-ame6]